jgi:uncharacterized membrane protein
MNHKPENQADATRANKRAEFTNNESKKTNKILIGMIALAVIATITYLVLLKSDEGIPTKAINTQQQTTSIADEIQIPLSDVSSGEAKFFDHKISNDKSMRFFVIKTSDAKYRIALDACEVCHHAKKGYKQEGEKMVCRNCGRDFDAKLINEETTDGCHPIGVPHRVDEKYLVIKKTDLEKGAQYF